MSKSKISRDEMRRRIEAKEEGDGGGGQGVGGQESAEASPSVRVTMWGGMRNYECGECAYATLSAEGMARHLRGVHGWVEKAVASGQWPVASEEGEAAAAVVGGQESAQ